MSWKDTVIKNIKWKSKLTQKEDGKLDFDFRLPLQELFERQAKRAYMEAVCHTMQFYAEHQGKPIEVSDLIAFFDRCGLPELAKAIKEQQP